MSRKKKGGSEEPGAPAWMATFSDLTTLLLCFFILLYSFSALDVQKFKAFVDSFNGQGILDYGSEPIPKEEDASFETDNTPKDGETENIDEELQAVYEEITSYLEKNNLQNDIYVEFVPRGLMLTIKEKVLFDSGKAELSHKSKDVLNKLAGLFNNLSHDISVEGHTDNIPTNPTYYATNWELSAARAISVVRFFTEKNALDPRKFMAIGYGEWQPIAPNNTPENRQLNRRVVVKILTKGE